MVDFPSDSKVRSTENQIPAHDPESQAVAEPSLEESQRGFEMEYREAKGAAQGGTEKEVFKHLKSMREHGKKVGLTEDALDQSEREVWQVYYQRAVQEAKGEAQAYGSEIPHSLFGQKHYRKAVAHMAGIAAEQLDRDNAAVADLVSEGNFYQLEGSMEKFVKSTIDLDMEGAARGAENTLAWGAAYLNSLL